MGIVPCLEGQEKCLDVSSNVVRYQGTLQESEAKVILRAVQHHF